MSGNLERMLKAAGQQVSASKPILELNPEHPMVAKLKDEQNDEQFSDWTSIIFDQALLAEGGQLEDPASFVKKLNAMLLQRA
jgi:molecular chaperone HtpG